MVEASHSWVFDDIRAYFVHAPEDHGYASERSKSTIGPYAENGSCPAADSNPYGPAVVIAVATFVHRWWCRFSASARRGAGSAGGAASAPTGRSAPATQAAPRGARPRPGVGRRIKRTSQGPDRNEGWVIDRGGRA